MGRGERTGRVRWRSVLERAVTIVTVEPVGMTLRGLFWGLVSEGRLQNTVGHYRTLSARTAETRRAGRFPALVDRGRRIQRPQMFGDPDDAQRVAAAHLSPRPAGGLTVDHLLVGGETRWRA
jgi:hypothetical protein